MLKNKTFLLPVLMFFYVLSPILFSNAVRGLSNFGPFMLMVISFFSFVIPALLVKELLKEGLPKFEITLRNTLKAVAMTMVLFGVQIILSYLMVGESTGSGTISALNKEGFVYLFFFTVIAAPISEEIFFRYGMKTIVNFKIPFILISSLSFSLFHLSEGSINYFTLLFSFISGLVYSSVYYEEDNLYLPILSHALFNFINISLFYLSIS